MQHTCQTRNYHQCITSITGVKETFPAIQNVWCVRRHAGQQNAWQVFVASGVA
jgi:hypothetical protein